VFPLPWFEIATHVITGVCVLWLFSGFWVTIFQCTPYRAVFDFSLKPIAKCLDFGTFVFVYELLNASIDVTILVLPVLVIPKLQLKLRQKIQVLMIFFMGGL
jgi:multisubunit Na+/H+ antiporter MnhE subunit